jgi:hypothetical protein
MAKTGRKPKTPEKKLKPRGWRFSMDDATYERLVAVAEANGRTIYAEARYALRRYLDEAERR